jgi:TetR/AcrR family transcriptional regulator
MSTTPTVAGARAILDAATALFADDGFDSTSVASIAEKAGVCKANVFHHFPSKEELYLAVMKEASAAHADYAEELCHAPGSSVDKLRKLIEFEIRNLLDNPQRTRLTLREVSDTGHACVRKLARNMFRRNFTAVVNIFEQGRQRGEFRSSIDSAAAAMLLGGAAVSYFNCRGLLREVPGAGGVQGPAAYADRIVALIFSGVLATPEAAQTKQGRRSRRLPAEN